jgi:hypothetical protein
MRNQLGHYEDELAVLRRDFDGFNREMPDTVAGLVRQRRQELERNRNVLSSLPFPVRKREDAVIPVPVKRVLRLPKPADKAQGQFEREHELPDGDYEEILAATRSMGWVMERAPNTFTGLHEEGIRDFFLALLNVGFRGAAMAEVFNGRGRTDILIRVGDRNVFIAECKVWESADKLKEGIDQLLSYAGWRDTKCAILLFVRQRNVTAIVETAEKVFKSHECYVGEKPAVGETERRYIFHWPGDERRLLTLTLQVFPVPITQGGRSRKKPASDEGTSPAV